jgi:hypothetical protein
MPALEHHHPMLNFQLLDGAYKFLSDPIQRSEYDGALKWVREREMGAGTASSSEEEQSTQSSYSSSSSTVLVDDTTKYSQMTIINSSSSSSEIDDQYRTHPCRCGEVFELDDCECDGGDDALILECEGCCLKIKVLLNA